MTKLDKKQAIHLLRKIIIFLYRNFVKFGVQNKRSFSMLYAYKNINDGVDVATSACPIDKRFIQRRLTYQIVKNHKRAREINSVRVFLHMLNHTTKKIVQNVLNKISHASSMTLFSYNFHSIER